MRLFLTTLLVAVAAAVSLTSCATNNGRAGSSLEVALQEIEAGVSAQRAAGHASYDPQYVFIVDPAKQRMHVLARKGGGIVTTVRCGTGKNGLGFGEAQTPTGFFTMGGVRIARNADTSIQTGDSKKGVSGVYAEILYPPSYAEARLRGRVPNNVVIHSYNPEVSAMLRERRAQRLIGRVPCTTGCPVPDIDEAGKLVPYLRAGAGRFDPETRPNAALQSLIAQGKVTQYSTNRLGAGVFIMGGSAR